MNETVVELMELQSEKLELLTLVGEYLIVLDDQEINDDEMKEWLDRNWIPRARRLCEKYLKTGQP